MFEVTKYAHPVIFVKCRRTAETYKFEVGDDGALTHGEAGHDQGAARRAAIAYLLQLKSAAAARMASVSPLGRQGSSA